MELKSNNNHKISFEEAKKFTAGYRAEKAEFMSADKMNDKEAKKGGFFGKDDLLELLNQKGCIGMRYYYGRNDDGSKNLVLVGVNGEGNDILPNPENANMVANRAGEDEEAIILERGLPCPPYCSSINGFE